MARKLIPNDIIEQMAAEYTNGASSYELAEKYGLHPASIRRLMIKRGLGKGKGSTKGIKNKGNEMKSKYAFERCAALTLEASNGTIELVEWISKSKGRYLCHVCGTEWYRCNATTRYPKCPTCDERERAQRKTERETEAKRKAERRAEEYAKVKICKSCGNVFHSFSPTQLYCCGTCQRREKRKRDTQAGKLRLICSGNHRKRARLLGVAYEPGITLKKLIERDGNQCQICGYSCNPNDKRWGEYFGPLYPTIDHVIAMAKGGGHTWDNVQLAHAICNSIKRDLGQDELTDEVISYAKEQAIRYKLA